MAADTIVVLSGDSELLKANYFYRELGVQAGKAPICATGPVVGELNFVLMPGMPMAQS